MSLLGAMILDPQVVGEVLRFVTKPEQFYSQAHGVIFKAIVDVYDRHNSGDLVQIQDALRDQNVLEDIGGGDYLVELAQSVPSAVNAPHYARIVREKYKLRRLIDAAGLMLHDAYNSSDVRTEDGQEIIDRAEMAVFEIAQEDQSNDAERLSKLLQEELERLEAVEGKGISGVSTGFGDLDTILSGLQGGEMIIVAARPSMGKTALALNMAEQMAFGGHAPGSGPDTGQRVPVGVFSLEMSKAAVTQRLLSAYSGIDSHKMRTGQFSPQEFTELMQACGTLSEAPLYIDDTPGLSVLGLRARARRMVAQHDVKAVIIDYLQLLSSPSGRESRQVEVSNISRSIKALARELSIPVVCLAQLNRGTEQREGNRPRMSDLRESGSIEQDADVVALLHRESYYHQGDLSWIEENEEKLNLTELIVAKQRNGPTGVVKLTWDQKTTRFKNFSPNYSDDYGYSAPGSAGRPAQEPKRTTFSPGQKTGPVSGFRDGGGPSQLEEEDIGGLPI